MQSGIFLVSSRRPPLESVKDKIKNTKTKHKLDVAVSLCGELVQEWDNMCTVYNTAQWNSRTTPLMFELVSIEMHLCIEFM